MVVKPEPGNKIVGRLFESSVIPSGSKTFLLLNSYLVLFESSVIPSGSKTALTPTLPSTQLESSVIPSGSSVDLAPGLSLRLSVV